MYKIVGFAKIPQTFCSIFIKTSHKKFGEARKCSYLYGVEIKGSEGRRVFQGGIHQNTFRMH
jgi:hypothetical protein